MFKGLDELRRNSGGGHEFTWRKFPLPLKFFIVFGIASYAVQVYVAYAPPFSRPSFALAYLICPVCFLTPTTDPTISDIVYFIGPIDAVLYGTVGAVIGYLLDTFM